MTDEKEQEFLKESNAIEAEYSKEALEDAIEAWEYGKIYVTKYKKITMQLALDIHKILLQRLYPDIAGKIRDCNVMIGWEIKDDKPEEIEAQLKRWAKETKKSTTWYDIKISHIAFELIHPFQDGNGRVGRIIMNLENLIAGLPIQVIHEGEEQQKYYKWFKKL